MPGFAPAMGFTIFYLSATLLIPLAALVARPWEHGWAAFWATVSDPRVLAALRPVSYTHLTLLQVAVNPLITSLGAPRSMHSRLTFAQFFNSLGVFLMIRFGAQIILGDSATSDPDGLSGGALRQFRISQSLVISQAYLGIAAVLAVLAIAFWIARRAMRCV